MPKRLLIVEDDASLNQMLALHFEDRGFQVTQAHDCAQGRRAAGASDYDLILLDQQLPDGRGIDLLSELLQRQGGATVVMMTGRHDLELAIQAIKLGAADFVHKPIHTDTLQNTVEQALAKRARDAGRAADVEAGAGEEREPPPVRDLIGRSAAMIEVSKDIALCAENEATVLITGESGTGKEVVARLIHQHSGRRGPFVAVNCAAIVDTLLESELFGHEKGAFTGATGRKPGRFEQAKDGTLFLDEIGELAPALQAKLLRALQERVIERVGGTEPVPTNARVIAATHRDLFGLVASNGGFREDLAYRLNVINISLPALRERPEDIPLLASALLKKNAARYQTPPAELTRAALDKLQAHHWPGNVRELENVLTQALVQARGAAITPELIRFRGVAEEPAITPESTPAGEPLALKTLEEVEAEHVQRVLTHTGGHKGRTCEILGISRPALDRKIAKYRLQVGKG